MYSGLFKILQLLKKTEKKCTHENYFFVRCISSDLEVECCECGHRFIE